jgi:hypothetical protein
MGLNWLNIWSCLTGKLIWRLYKGMNSKLWTAFLTGYIGALGFGFYNSYYTQRVMAEHNAKLKRQWEDKLNKDIL